MILLTYREKKKKTKQIIDLKADIKFPFDSVPMIVNRIFGYSLTDQTTHEKKNNV